MLAGAEIESSEDAADAQNVKLNKAADASNNSAAAAAGAKDKAAADDKAEKKKKGDELDETLQEVKEEVAEGDW